MLTILLGRKVNEQKLQVVSEFLSRFQLTEEEQAALHSGEVNDNFFNALKRVGQIYSDCPILLRTHQKMGYVTPFVNIHLNKLTALAQSSFEVMELMSMHQQSAYDRVYRWVKDQFASLKDDLTDLHPHLITAVATLQEKQPVLLR